jgi:hypothetical protein
MEATTLLLTPAQARAKCHIGEGATSCKYLVVGSLGFECGATNPFVARAVEDRAQRGLMTARSGPCADPRDETSEAAPWSPA